MSEQELILGVRQKNETAFREVVERYRSGILNTCYAMVHDTDDAEDIAQEVFIELHRSAGGFRGDSRLSTWLYRIAVNKSLNHLSKNKRKKFITNGTEEFNNIPCSETHPAEQKENRKILHTAIDSLPKNQKIAFTLHKYDDLSYKEIADIMDISLSSVESLIFRAKKNLQHKLEKYYKSKL